MSAPLDDPSTSELIQDYRRTGDRTLRNRVVDAYRGLAATLAREFDRSSEPFDDRFQVALLGLVKAADRFDPAYGSPFAAFAAVTVRGELRRHFRDHGWSVRVPRRLQELRYEIRAATDVLTERNARSPTPGEVATYLHVSVDEVIDALCADDNYRARSLDHRSGDHGADIAERLGSAEHGFDAVDAAQAFAAIVASCPPRLRRLLRLRYVEGMKQSEIAEQLDISQVHVSRLLAQAHQMIRPTVDADGSTVPALDDQRETSVA